MKALFLSVIIICCGFSAFADSPQDRHADIKKSYFRLKNIDPEVKDITAWSEVVSAYKSFIAEQQALDDKVFFEYGSLLFQYADSTKNEDALLEADKVLGELLERFPNSTLVDDALLKSVEILKIQGASTETIADAYLEVIEKYPDSDGAEIARAFLNNLNNPVSDQSEESDPTTPTKEAIYSQETNLASLPIVVIDPGHGGEDFGAENQFGLLEKDVVLSIALEAEQIINERRIAKVLLARRTDKFVTLPDRIALANQNQAALFLSLHNNASPKHTQSGISAYVLDSSSDEASRLLAERENKSSGNADNSDLDFIVSDLVQSSKQPKSVLLAETIDKAVIASVKSVWPSAKSIGVKKAPFYVLVGAHMPCALIELFFLDHANDGEQLSDPQIRKAIANGIAKGVQTFLEKSSG